MAVTTDALPTLDPLDFLAIDALLDDEEKAIRDTVGSSSASRSCRRSATGSSRESSPAR